MVIFCRGLVISLSLLAVGCSDSSDETQTPAPVLEPAPPTESIPPPEPLLNSPQALGERLFFDPNLSLNRSQSCATCHDSGRAFTDARLDAAGLTAAFSVGDDGFSQAGRNAPTLTYAAWIPDFTFGSHPRFNSTQPDYEGYIGGQFMDGRAVDLVAQARQPPLGAAEMGMPGEASVVERLLENEDYAASFRTLYGEDIFENVGSAYAAMAESIAAFERTESFSTFDSRYDKSLTGEYVYEQGTKAARGREMFFSEELSNCSTCHQGDPDGSMTETFSNYEYHNIGTPVNEDARRAAGLIPDALDEGLLGNPQVDDPLQAGKFRVPTLRNVAVTGPYMNNGVFRRLETVVRFYDHFTEDSKNHMNPETGAHWAPHPFHRSLNRTVLEDATRMSDADIEALVCFMRTLTDERYEALIEEDGINCD